MTKRYLFQLKLCIQAWSRCKYFYHWLMQTLHVENFVYLSHFRYCTFMCDVLYHILEISKIIDIFWSIQNVWYTDIIEMRYLISLKNLDARNTWNIHLLNISDNGISVKFDLSEILRYLRYLRYLWYLRFLGYFNISEIIEIPLRYLKYDYCGSLNDVVSVWQGCHLWCISYREVTLAKKNGLQ